MAHSNAIQKMQAISESQSAPVAAHLDALGGEFPDEVFHSQVLVMTYVRTARTSGGIILPGQSLEEDRFQGKIGLVVGIGPGAFKDDGEVAKFHGKSVALHDWVLTRPADGMEFFYNGCSLRMFQDVNILAKVSSPDRYW